MTEQQLPTLAPSPRARFDAWRLERRARAAATRTARRARAGTAALAAVARAGGVEQAGRRIALGLVTFGLVAGLLLAAVFRGPRVTPTA